MLAEVVKTYTAESCEWNDSKPPSTSAIVKQSPTAAQRIALDPEFTRSNRLPSPRDADTVRPSPRVGLSSVLSSNSDRKAFVPLGGSMSVAMGNDRRPLPSRIAFGSLQVPATSSSNQATSKTIALEARTTALQERAGMRPLAEQQAAFPLFRTLAEGQESENGSVSSKHKLILPKEDIQSALRANEAQNAFMERHTRDLVSSSKHTMAKREASTENKPSLHASGPHLIADSQYDAIASSQRSQDRLGSARQGSPTPPLFASILSSQGSQDKTLSTRHGYLTPRLEALATPEAVVITSTDVCTRSDVQRVHELEKEVQSGSHDLKQGLQADSQRIHDLELAVDKLSKNFQDLNHSLQQQAREIAAEIVSNQIASVRQQVMQEAQLVIKEQANDFLYEALSKPTTSALLQKAFATSPHLSSHIQNVVDDRIRLGAMTFAREEVRHLGQEVVGDLGRIADEINAESELRARSINDLNAMLRFEVASVLSHVQATRIDLEEADAQARQTNIEELAKLRSMLDSVWSQATQPKEKSEANYYFKFIDPKGDGDAQYKECVGDSEDINTLYEMVREALGTSTMLRKDLDEEKARRERLQQDTLQLERHYRMLHRSLNHFQQTEA